MLKDMLGNEVVKGSIVAYAVGGGGSGEMKVAVVEKVNEVGRSHQSWWKNGKQFWLFTLYGKGEMNDLLPNEKKALKQQLKTELRIRKKP